MNKIICVLFVLFNVCRIYTQPVESVLLKSEFGFSVGTVTYIGDLNPYYNLNIVKPSFQIFYKKNNFLCNKLGVKFGIDYNLLHYADQYNDDNHIDLIARNLRFTNEIVGISTQLCYDFLNYNPFSNYNLFTPYLNIGIGAIYSNPFDFDTKNNKVYLQPLITERTSSIDKNVKYNNFVLTMPISLGFKASISSLLNIFTECTYTLTNTDYLDDVSGKYAGSLAFASNSIENYFQDKSNLQKLGVMDKNRGTAGSGNDGYISFKVGVSFNNFISCCPKVKKNYSY